jgi:hypothetical protein
MTRIEELLQEARTCLRPQNLARAQELLDEAARLKPEGRDIQLLLEETRARAEENAETPKTAPQSAEKKQLGAQQGPDLTRIGGQAPTGFFQAFPIDSLPIVDPSADRESSTKRLQTSVDFYRGHLDREFKALSGQADLVFKIWVVCVLVAFAALVSGIVTMFIRPDMSAAVTTASSVLLFFIQKIFQERENDYRTRADKKSLLLEYGNKWLLAMQTIDAMPESDAKRERQARAAEILTEGLGKP